MKGEKDAFLENRLARYERWMAKGKIDFSARVIPVREAIDTRQWILPASQVRDILQAADPIAVTACVCRSHYQRCGHPVDVCLLLNSVAAAEIKRKQARPVSLKAAKKILETADKEGLVHLTFHMPGPDIYALCSCCACCCHDLQILKQYHRPDLVVRSDFIAVDAAEKCVHCSLCVDRCIFDARRMIIGKMHFDPARCYGCGLCATICPAGAIGMRPRAE